MARQSASSMAGLLAESMTGDPDIALARWAACGAMALTGAADGPPSGITARVAPAADVLASIVADLSAEVGQQVSVDGAALLGERAAIARMTRRGSTSCGGATNLLRTNDGWLAVSLARGDDVHLLDAWLGESLGVSPTVPVSDWGPIVSAVSRRTTAELVATGALLGLPVAALGEVTAATPLVIVEAQPMPGRRRSINGATVVDLSSLWAGPLCAQLLGLAGAHVIKVESVSRPDGARFGPPEFFDLLHAGHRSVALDFGTDDGRRWLRRLIASADIVIEASRPRALASLGASYELIHQAGWRGVWVSITGYGRSGDAATRVAFGDDAAVAGGLVSRHASAPVFCADAIADPVSGLVAAASVLECVDRRLSGIVGVSLASSAAHLTAGVRRNPLPDDPAPGVVAPPQARLVSGRAASIGVDTDTVLGAL